MTLLQSLCGAELKPRNLDSVLAFATELLCKSPARAALQNPGAVPGIILVVTLFSLCLVRSFRIFIIMAPQEYKQQIISVTFLLAFLRSPYKYIRPSAWI